jgi:hypothetical protein
VLRLNVRPPGQFFGGRPSTDVELVNGREIIDGERSEIFARRLERGEDLTPEFGNRVVP